MDTWVVSYLDHFGLNRRPFQAEGGPPPAWLANRYRTISARLKRGLDEQKGFVILIDADGSAKNALISELIQDSTRHAVHVTAPDSRIGTLDFFKQLAESFQFKQPVDSKGGFFLQFRDHVQETGGSDKSLVLILDEADRMGKELIEALFQLSDAKMDNRRLLSCLLIGSEHLIEGIFDPADPKISERVAAKIYPSMLNSQEAGLYIRDCLKSAGAVGPVFQESAELEVFRFSRGKLWLIDSICELALICGFQKGKRSIDNQIIGESARQLGLPDKKNFDRAAFLKNALDITEQIGLLAAASADNGQAAAASRQTKVRAAKKIPPVPAPEEVEPRRNEDRYFLGNSHDVAPAGWKTGLPATIRKKRSPLLNIFYAMISLCLLVSMGYVWMHLYVEDKPRLGTDELIIKKSQSGKPLEEIDLRASAKAPGDSPGAPVAMPNGDASESVAKMAVPEKLSIYFDDKFYELKVEDLVVLQELAEHLVEHPQKKVTLRGYSSSSGTHEHNLNVSRFQVNIVKSYLIAKGVPEDHIRALALGNMGAADYGSEAFQARKVMIEISSTD